jgi:general secretion pathway protein A
VYESFFNLRTKPFDLLPNPSFLYQSKSHKRAMTYLDYGIKSRSGFILVTGEVGSGKTTIIRDLIKKKIPKVVLSKVFNTKVSSEQLISMINDDFGLPVQGKDKIQLLRELNEFLIDQFAKDMQPVLIIDEAQNLSPELLEEVRMLSNLETEQAKLLQIILVGQPELKRILTSPDMLQLRQRININCHIQPLTATETGEYVLHRLEKAGNREAVAFDPEVLALIHTHSRGVPRLINIICDFFMLSMFSEETRAMDVQTAMEILKELDFEQQFWQTDVENASSNLSGSNGDLSGKYPDLEKTKIKLSALLKDLTQPIEYLERNADQWNRKVFLDGSEERISRLEESMAQQVLQLEILGEEIHKLQVQSPTTHQEEGMTDHLDATSTLPDADTKHRPQSKSFFRRLFGKGAEG